MNKKMAISVSPHLNFNRLMKEDWEDREYIVHVKKLQEIQNRGSKLGNYPTNNQTVKFPQIKTIKKTEMESDSNDTLAERHRSTRGRVDNWNPGYVKRRNRTAFKSKFRNEIEIENERLKNRILNTKGVYDLKKWDKEYESHQAIVKSNNRKFYTPRGMGYRKSLSLPEVRRPPKRNKNPIKMLNEAVNKLERGDVVLMKTLVKLNYSERMETKAKYEEEYDSDLKKGLIKVMDKQYEPLIQALLSDMDLVDVDRIYESLYDSSEASTTVTEALLVRTLEEKKTLLESFEQKIDSSLDKEIKGKIEGDLRQFLLAFLENDNLDNEKTDSDKAKNDANELKKASSSSVSFNSPVFLNLIKNDSRAQLKEFFNTYQRNNGGIDICAKTDQHKPVVKAVKLIQAYVNNPNAYLAEKLQKNLKSNKAEFLRQLAIYSQPKLDQIIAEYNQKYSTTITNDIKENFSEDVSKLILKILNKGSSD